MLLCVLKHEDTLGRLEKSGRLLRSRLHGSIFAVAAQDQGDALKYIRASDAAKMGLESVDMAWDHIQQNMNQRAETLQIFGLAPFWFVDCPGWPPSAFLAWHGFCAWAQQTLETSRPLMAASFSADQLILGFADSAEFHDRMGHAREAPMAQPLLPLPFLLRANERPLPISKIDLYLGNQVILYADDDNRSEIGLVLPEE